MHTGSQFPPAALYKGVMLSSRIQRKCIKPGSAVYPRNHHRVVSFYFENVSTCHCSCLIISSCILSSREQARVEFREISCSTAHPSKEELSCDKCVQHGRLRETDFLCHNVSVSIKNLNLYHIPVASMTNGATGRQVGNLLS